jgi:hypothetical protein
MRLPESWRTVCAATIEAAGIPEEGVRRLQKANALKTQDEEGASTGFLKW